jgi:hypothetical protein
VTASNDRLIGIVGIHVQTAAGKDACQNVASARDALAVFSSDADREIYSSHDPILSSITPTKQVNKGTSTLKQNQNRSARIFISFSHFCYWQSLAAKYTVK